MCQPSIRSLILTGLSVLLAAACVPAATPTAVPTAAPTQAAATPTEAPTQAAATPTEAPTQAATTPTEAPTQAAATPSGQLVVYTSRSEALFTPVVNAFEAEYPEIDVIVVTGRNGELAARLLEERANPAADVLVNSDTLTMEDLAAQGIFQPNDSAVVAAVPAGFRAEDGSWAALTLRSRVIMYNTDLVAPDDLPDSVLDLTDPRWRGQIGSADSTNGAMLAHLVVLREQIGEEAAEQFVRDLVANEVQFFGSHTDVRNAVGAGELALGFVNHYYYFLSKAEGQPVGIIYPDQEEGGLGLVVNSTNAGIIAGAPNATAAEVFVDWMLSPAGQQVYAQGNYEYPIVPGVALAEGVEPLDGFARSPVDLITMWNELGPTREMAIRAGLP
jgi:iron(III) transport system substrate-binding protein